MTRYQIEAPLKGFTGNVVGVDFKGGTGYVEDTSDGGRSALAYFKRSGYGVAVAPEESTEEPGPAPVGDGQPPAPPAGPFDPSAHTVADVLVYLGEADAGEALRVLDAEAAGQAPRKGITSQREQLLATKTPITPAAADDQKEQGA